MPLFADRDRVGGAEKTLASFQHDWPNFSVLLETAPLFHVGSVTPPLGGVRFRHDAFPACTVSRRKRVEFDGRGLRPLDSAEVRGLTQSVTR